MSNANVTRTPTVFFTSDLHFGHDKEFIWKDRGFNSVEEMNNAIVERWNAVVESDDEVWVLGDLLMGQIDTTKELLLKLNGNLHIIAGNHDSNKKLDFYCSIPGVEYHGYADVKKFGRRYFYMSHFPTLVKNGSDSYIWNIHGHTHSKNKFSDNDFCYNVNMDAHNCTPVSIAEIQHDINEYMQKKENKENKKENIFIKLLKKIK